MSAPTPEQRAAWRQDARRWVASDGPWLSAPSKILALLDALDAAERREAEWSRRFEEWQSNNLTSWVERAERAEAALARVEALAEKWAGWGQVDSVKANTVAREIRAALNGADA